MEQRAGEMPKPGDEQDMRLLRLAESLVMAQKELTECFAALCVLRRERQPARPHLTVVPDRE